MERTLRFASAPINWGVGPLDPRNPDPDRVLDAIAEAGYEGSELGTYGFFGYEAEDILARFRARNLALVTTWHEVDLAQPLSPQAEAELRTLCGILKAGEAQIILISDRITPERLAVVARVEDHPETWWDSGDWQQVRQTLLNVAAIAAEYDLIVAVHPHVGGHIESGPEIRRVLDLTDGDPIYLCLDTGHIRIGGSDPIALLERECGRLRHVHAKDVDAAVLERLRAGALTYEEAVDQGLYAPLGAGIVDWQGLKRGLAACDYRGWIVAEQDRIMHPDDPAPWELNRRNAAFLRSLFTA